MRNTAAGIQFEIAKGVFRPHTALTNMALAYYQNAANYFAKALFPTCPVSLSSDNYYEFSKEDLLRDNWSRKPAYGKVDPTVVGESMKPYVCQVDQMIMGIDQIRQTDLSRRQGPTTMQPKQQRVKTIAEQANIHQDRLFAESYFKAGAWKNELSGVDTTSPSTNEFIKFSNANSDPIAFIDSEKTKINLYKVDKETGKTVPQGDATLKVAVYGLYAREDIVHPDGATGTVYKAGEQVASLTTDDKGQASVKGLYLGKYYIKEITPPTGYLADTEEHDLVCSYEGDMTAEVV